MPRVHFSYYATTYGSASAAGTEGTAGEHELVLVFSYNLKFVCIECLASRDLILFGVQGGVWEGVTRAKEGCWFHRW